MQPFKVGNKNKQSHSIHYKGPNLKIRASKTHLFPFFYQHGSRSTKEKRTSCCYQKEKVRIGAQTDCSTEEAEKALKFRSYTPNDEKLKEHVNIATPSDIGDTVESETKNLTKETLAEAAEKQKEEVDLFNLAPKKPNCI
ncbi:unnamed protein product [Mucor hiemalis]